MIWLSWLASEPQGPSRLYLSSADITSTYHHAQGFFSVGLGIEHSAFTNRVILLSQPGASLPRALLLFSFI